MKKNLITRSLTSVFLLVAISLWMFIGAIYLEPRFGSNRDWAGYLFITINSLLLIYSLIEIINLRKTLKWGWLVKLYLLLIGVIFLWLPIGNEHYLFYVYNEKWFHIWISLLIVIACLLVLLLFVFSKKSKFILNDFLFMTFFLFYLVLTFKGINFLMLEKVASAIYLGWPTLIFVWIIVISSDVGGYLGGSLFGKNKMFPKISPKKTWEGAITGFLVSVLLAMVFITIMTECSTKNVLPIYPNYINGRFIYYFIYFIICCLLSILAPLGDLLFSAIKRLHNVKDYSQIFPGHGGLLDRLDSFSLVIIMTFLLTTILI